MLNRSLDRLIAAVRRPAGEAVLAAVVAVSAAAVVAWMARASWFVFDHWDFLTKREIGSLEGLFGPHAGHWQTYTVVVHRLLYGLAGLDFSPWYVIPRAVFPAAAAYAAFLAVRWRGTESWLAWPVFAVLLFSGVSGWHSSATLGNSLVHAAALVVAVVVARAEEPAAGDLFLAGAALAVALSASSLGLAVFGGVALAVTISGRLRAWWPALALPAVLYLLWYLTFGIEASTALDLSGDTLRAAPGFAYDVVAAAVGRVLWAAEWPGWLLVAGLAAVVAWSAHRRRIGVYEGVLLAAAAVYVPMVVLRRVATGQASVEATRYAYVLTMLLVPALVPTLRVARRRVRAAIVAVILVVLAGNVAMLRGELDEWERTGRSSREVVEAAAGLLIAGEPALPVASPDPPRDGQLTVAGLRLVIDDGWVPDAATDPAVVAAARANIRILAQEGFRTVARGPRTEAVLDGEGCAAVPGGGRIEMRIGRGVPISVVGEDDAVAVLEWRDRWGTGVMEVPVGGASWILWLADPGDDRTVLAASARHAALRVCGLRSG